MKAVLLDWIDLAFAAVVNGGYQGLLLAALVGLAFKWFSINAATRHAVWMTLLGIVVTLPVLHFLFAPLSLSGTEPAGSEFDVEPVAVGFVDGDWIEVPLDEEPVPVTDAAAGPEILAGSGPIEQLVGENPGGAVLDGAAGSRWWSMRTGGPRWAVSLPFWIPCAAVTVWLVVGFWKLVRLGGSYMDLMRLKRSAVTGWTAELATLFEQARMASGLTRRVRFGLSDCIVSPVAAGFGRPMILLPRGLAQAADDKVLIPLLRHELAHLKRRDDWTNLVAQCLRALFWCLPAVWWLCRRLEVDREIACDDHVLASTRARRGYALILTDLASRKVERSSSPAPAAWNTKSQIRERIEMILDTKRNANPGLARAGAGGITLAAVLLAVAAYCCGPRMAMAQESTPVRERPAAGINVQPRQITDDDAIEARPTSRSRATGAAVNLEQQERGSGSNVAESASRAGLSSSASRPSPGAASVTAVPEETETVLRTLERSRRASDMASADARDESMEARLARLETLVERLVAQGESQRRETRRNDREYREDGGGYGGTRRNSGVGGGPGFGSGGGFGGQSGFGRTDAFGGAGLGEDAFSSNFQVRKEQRTGLERVLRELTAQREALRRQMESLERQLEEVEAELQRSVSDLDRDSSRPGN